MLLVVLGYAISKGLSKDWSRQDSRRADDDGETRSDD
jgi:hypothetical protein